MRERGGQNVQGKAIRSGDSLPLSLAVEALVRQAAPEPLLTASLLVLTEDKLSLNMLVCTSSKHIIKIYNYTYIIYPISSKDIRSPWLML